MMQRRQQSAMLLPLSPSQVRIYDALFGTLGDLPRVVPEINPALTMRGCGRDSRGLRSWIDIIHG